MHAIVLRFRFTVVEVLVKVVKNYTIKIALALYYIRSLKLSNSHPAYG